MVEIGDGWFEIPSFAKINLFLDVLRKRDDGYHELVGLFQTISFHDTIRLRMIDDGLKIESTRFIPEKNIVETAVEVFKKETGIDFGMEILIVKRIPMMAGFGGGSSNAGAVLKFLGKVFDVPKEDLLRIASKVGSDVPFFLESGTAIVRGKGDVVERMEPLPEYGVVLAVPKIRIDTKRAYSYLKEEDFSKSVCDVEELYRAYKEFDFETIRRCSYNIFQEVLKDYYLEIDITLKHLERSGGIVSMMTGSGSGCFSIFPPGEGVFKFTDGSFESRRLL